MVELHRAEQRGAFQLEVQQEENQLVFEEPSPNRFVKQEGCTRLFHSPSCIPLIAGKKKVSYPVNNKNSVLFYEFPIKSVIFCVISLKTKPTSAFFCRSRS